MLSAFFPNPDACQDEADTLFAGAEKARKEQWFDTATKLYKEFLLAHPIFEHSQYVAYFVLADTYFRTALCDGANTYLKK